MGYGHIQQFSIKLPCDWAIISVSLKDAKNKLAIKTGQKSHILLCNLITQVCFTVVAAVHNTVWLLAICILQIIIYFLQYLKSTATILKLSLKAFRWYRQEYQNCKVILKQGQWSSMHNIF